MAEARSLGLHPSRMSPGVSYLMVSYRVQQPFILPVTIKDSTVACPGGEAPSQDILLHKTLIQKEQEGAAGPHQGV